MAIHPEIESLIKAAAAARRPRISESSPDVLRALQKEALKTFPPGPEMMKVEDKTICGNPYPWARVYTPYNSISKLIVYFHGGGWVLSSPEYYDGHIRRLAAATGCVVASVGYRLAPESPFPAAVEDACLGLLWAIEQKDNLTGKPASVLIVCGDSAGGNLASVSVRHVLEKGYREVAGQILVYPVVDCRFDTFSYENNANVGLMTSADMVRFWELYVPDERLRSDPRASPLRAPSFNDYPPTLILLAEHDPLFDEGRAYAERLRESAVDVQEVIFPGMVHGFFALEATADLARPAFGEIARFVEQMEATHSS